MAKIFRLHTQGVNTLTDWGSSTKYSTNVINQIVDPNGASASKEITSIPSPFARMDLVKNAFKEVANNKILDGNTIYHKLVSDCFDVGQIFFEIEKFRDQVEILVWDKQNDLDELLNSPNLGNKLLGETYRMFLQQDAQTYNFGQMKRIYLLNFKNGPAITNIIGATSPATLFFTSANNLNYVSAKLRFGNDAPFDVEYMPLYNRDIEYQKFWYLLQKTMGNFASLFPEVNDYLIESFKHLQSQNQQIIRNLTNQDLGNFAKIHINGNAGNTVEVLGTDLLCKIPNQIDIQRVSDFVIKSDFTINHVLPLVLPIETYTHALYYTQSNWDRNNQVPFKESMPLEQRILPNDGSQYPYLTISDFLEDTIVRLPYEMNSNSFFDGHINKANAKSYLLPLKTLFFDFFNAEQLKGNMSDGKKMFEIKDSAAGVSVTLRIPIKKGYIEYHRAYYEHNTPKIDNKNNDGALVEYDFAFSLFPNISFSKSEDAFYRIGLIMDFNDSDSYDLKCYFGNNSIPHNKIIRNDNNREYKKCSTYALDGSNFDYIQISSANNKGIIVPRFYKESGSDQYTFAVDFGTTNTHVEYSVNDLPSKPLDITKEELQIHLLTKCEVVEQYILDYDFLPSVIGSNEDFKFPMRTALSESKNTNWNVTVFPMANANIPFPYEKRDEYKYNRILTGLKWSNDLDNIKKVKCYIESLFLILRNKVILNNGDLSKTRIVWFYPISMTRNRFNLFDVEWKAAYVKYFKGAANNIIPVTESVAPYEYFKGAVGHAANMVTIDIGGGTSDIVIAENGSIQYITSFRFAANSIFGNGYANHNGLVKNGIVQQFRPVIQKLLSDNSLSGLRNICDDLDNKNDSNNLASFFFSLKENKMVGDNIDFNKMLCLDDSQKMVFIFFYVAIIYHLAQIMKIKNLAMPRHINFSGNGSKVLKVLSMDMSVIEQFTKIIFEKIYDCPYNSNGLKIHPISNNPKEATCKGGISCQVAQEYSKIANTKVVLLSAKKDVFVSSETYKNIKEDETGYINQTVQEASEFIEFTLKLNNSFSFKNNFGLDINSFEIAKKICFKDLNDFAKSGLAQKMNEVTDYDSIEETLFFYPLNGMLNALSTSIFEYNQKHLI